MSKKSAICGILDNLVIAKHRLASNKADFKKG